MYLIQDTQSNLEQEVIKIISKKISELSKNQEKVILAIPGGRSVSGIFKLLKNSSINWKKVHIFMIDERLVPINDEQSNFKLANEILLKYHPRENIHPYTSNHTIESYTRELKSVNLHEARPRGILRQIRTA